MDKFKKKKKKSRRRENLKKKNIWHNWYDWLISNIPKPIKKPWVVLKTKL